MAAETLGIAIRRARNRRRWTQMQLAERAGVSVRTVGDWERGVKAPRNLTVVEDILGVSLNGDPEPESYNDDPLYEAIWAETSLPPGMRREIIQQIRQARSGPAARTERPPALGQ